MARLLSIDYGKKRTGIAVSDELQLIANGLTTLPTQELFTWLEDYLKKESVEAVVVGYPRQMNGEDSENMKRITPFVNRLKKSHPELKVVMYDERFTSVLAQQTILQGGVHQKERRENKGLVDQISACIILQDYMESRRNAPIPQ